MTNPRATIDGMVNEGPSGPGALIGARQRGRVLGPTQAHATLNGVMGGATSGLAADRSHEDMSAAEQEPTACRASVARAVITIFSS